MIIFLFTGSGEKRKYLIGEDAFYTQSMRGKPLIVFNKYTYCRHSDRNGIVRWTCSTHSYKCCKAVVKTSGRKIVEVKGFHNHDASELMINRSKPASDEWSGLNNQMFLKNSSLSNHQSFYWVTVCSFLCVVCQCHSMLKTEFLIYWVYFFSAHWTIAETEIYQSIFRLIFSCFFTDHCENVHLYIGKYL